MCRGPLPFPSEPFQARGSNNDVSTGEGKGPWYTLERIRIGPQQHMSLFCSPFLEWLKEEQPLECCGEVQDQAPGTYASVLLPLHRLAKAQHGAPGAPASVMVPLPGVAVKVRKGPLHLW